MTSDAKIGLLLGLIFIFVIAFVINGLPSLRPPISKVEATTPLGDEDFAGGVEGKTGQAVDNWTQPPDSPRTGGEVAQTAVAEPKAAAQEPRPVAQGSLPLQPQPQTATEEGVRSSYPLAGIEKLIEQFTPTVQKDRVVADGGLGVHGPALESPAAGGRQEVAVAPQPRSEPAFTPKPLEALTKVETREVPKSANVADRLANVPSGRIYTAVDGDNLSTIAKKVYGLEEGNRMVNIKRIIQANQAVLPSPNAVRVGQKLIIPPLPKAIASPASAPSASRPTDVLPQTLFEKVESLGRRAPAASPASAPEGRWYTVQSGDSLWKIAASQLGSGTRCDEIAKLNAETLNSSDTLDVGMKLRLPPK
ncbi:MAG: LysM peptidoglycan-binding domain-containing protein [Phycisphaerae bacterium]|nr:LysM peptidoglycan-binding domain-containing protein [Phycisphaerae bacterium]